MVVLTYVSLIIVVLSIFSYICGPSTLRLPQRTICSGPLPVFFSFGLFFCC